MKDRAEHIVCAVATANGFAMPYRSVAAKKESEPRGKDMLPRAGQQAARGQCRFTP